MIVSPNVNCPGCPYSKMPLSQRCHYNRVTMTVFELVGHVKNEVAQPSKRTGRIIHLKMHLTLLAGVGNTSIRKTGS